VTTIIRERAPDQGGEHAGCPQSTHCRQWLMSALRHQVNQIRGLLAEFGLVVTKGAVSTSMSSII
jgi:hypothetical protein